MKTRSLTANWWAGVVSVLALTVLVAAGGSPPPIRGVEPTPFVTGIVSLAAGETAQLNASNVSRDRTITVQMAIYDAAGAVLGKSRQILRPGQSRFLVPATRRAGRQGLRATVHTVCGDAAAVPPDPVLVASTLEVVDLRTGATKHILTQ